MTEENATLILEIGTGMTIIAILTLMTKTGMITVAVLAIAVMNAKTGAIATETETAIITIVITTEKDAVSASLDVGKKQKVVIF